MAALLFCHAMPTTFFALILVILFHLPPALAESGDLGTQPDTPSAVAVPTEGCRECGLPYYRPSDTPSEAVAQPKAASEDQPKATSGAQASIEPDASSRRSHLSSDPRVKSARALVERERFAEALQILRPLAPDHRGSDGRAVSPGPGRQPGVPNVRSRGGDSARAAGRGHRGVPVHPDPPARTGARAPGTGPGPSI